MLCGFREVSRFVKTTRIHLKQATYLQCTVEIGHFALYPVRLKSISDPFKNIRNETIYQCDFTQLLSMVQGCVLTLTLHHVFNVKVTVNI